MSFAICTSRERRSWNYPGENVPHTSVVGQDSNPVIPSLEETGLESCPTRFRSGSLGDVFRCRGHIQPGTPPPNGEFIPKFLGNGASERVDGGAGWSLE